MIPTEHPEVHALQTAVAAHNIRIEALEKQTEESKITYRRLKLTKGDNSFIVPVDDEYQDVRDSPNNTPLMLHLILRACINYVEADDYLVWCKEAGLSASQAVSRKIYFDLQESAARILEIIDGKARPLSDWDFSMNTGVTQALRSLIQEDPI